MHLSRRDLLKQIGAAIALGTGFPFSAAVAARTRTVGIQAAGDALISLTPVESQILRAAISRLMPADENGPGALEARADRYIDRALSGALRAQRPVYAAGLAALNRYAQSFRGAEFVDLPAADQDAVLTELQYGRATGFTGSSSQFFDLVRAHMIQGVFGDPFYGGNANFAGWDLIGYPGARIVVSANLQRMDVSPESSRRGAYDYGMFSKAEF
jgi:gluconate 2-dehydrogenase gamma chain